MVSCRRIFEEMEEITPEIILSTPTLLRTLQFQVNSTPLPSLDMNTPPHYSWLSNPDTHSTKTNYPRARLEHSWTTDYQT